MNVYIVCEHASARQRLQECLPDVTLSGPSARCPRRPACALGLLARERFSPHRAQSPPRGGSLPLPPACRARRAGQPHRRRIGPADRRPLPHLPFRHAVLRNHRRVGKRWRLIKPSRTLLEKLVIRARRVLYSLGLHTGCVEMVPVQAAASSLCVSTPAPLSTARSANGSRRRS